MTRSPGTLFDLLRKGVVALFMLALLCGMALPLYSDEVGWRLQERAGLDGLDKLYAEQCGPNTLAVPPFFMWPVRWYSAFFNTLLPDPFWVRVSGVGYMLVWVWLVLRLIGRIGRDTAQRQVMAIIALSLMGFGVLPLLLVWSRPEQPILLAITAALVIAAKGWRSPGNVFAPFAGAAYAEGDDSPATAWRRSLAILALGIIALSYHFKAVLLIPAFAGAIMFASRGRRVMPIRVLAMVLLFAATAASWSYWTQRLACPNDPIIAAAHAKENLGGQMVSGDRSKLAILGDVIANYRPHKYVDMAAPTVKPMTFWLPHNRVSDEEMHGWQGGMAAIWALALALGAVSLLAGLWNAWRHRVLPPEPVLALLLYGGASVWMVSQLVRHAYESSFVLPLVMLSIVLGLAAPHNRPMLRQAGEVLSLAFAPLMALSLILVAGYYGTPLVQATRARGYIVANSQFWSVPLYGYGAVRDDLTALARQCHLPPPENASHVLIDDTTYFTYMRARLPQHHLAVTMGILSGTVQDPVAYLRAKHSSGILVGCHWLPAHLRERAHTRGMYCCLTPADWDKPLPAPLTKPAPSTR
ncbi:hypothetical protein GTZ99_02945 [Novosphingobium sp. FSY-8]|uniref:Glycosyltransferase RgtA/B/C/D-like domain-containing protein n=1 Tax=Novosphingobium ovatum TaxID=1908523 RepID=A0ABW9XAE6_9SPHN|nr:hypothetical protein [Novosphingobium ovatum]NBC35509.1 hypothetical protein [Novosphingobium ovatum]